MVAGPRSVAATGASSSIAGALSAAYAPLDLRWIFCDLERYELPATVAEADGYLLAAGFLAGERLEAMAPELAARTFAVNLGATVQLAERILAQHARARVAIIGSMSAFRGSYDLAYAVAKRGLVGYLDLRRDTLAPGQKLAVLCPPIIADSGMTRRRPDYPEILAKRETVMAADVAHGVANFIWGDLATGAFRILPGGACLPL